MAKKYIGIDFSELEILSDEINELNGNVKKTTEKALIESQNYIAKNVHTEMKKHYQTGQTEKSIVEDNKVKWVGNTASIGVGFSISDGGLASVFLLYGTPKMKKDQKLYNSIFGKKTREEISNIQAKVFYDEIEKLGG